VAIRNREYLAAVKPGGLFLILELMHFAQEVLQPEGLTSTAGTELSQKEIEMAKSLVESLSGPFEPEKYEDRYQAAVREMIEAKISDQPKTAKTKAPKPKGEVVDLLAVLQQSLQENADKRKTPAGDKSAKPRSTASLVSQKRRAGVLQKN
jgi:DNA end-binding protein Ku